MDNIAVRLDQNASSFPNQKAIIDAKTKASLTFREVNQNSILIAQRLKKNNIKKGDKVLMFVRPNLNFPSLVFGLFRLGAIPIFIDPGMGRKNLLESISQVKPDHLIGEPIIHFLKIIFSKSFKSIKTSWTTRFSLFCHKNILKLAPDKIEEEPLEKNPDDTAAILFTSGGTGVPKGVVYTHGIFSAQTMALQDMFELSEKDIDCPGFPLFSLFTLAMGMTGIIPEIDPAKPALVKPKQLVKNIQEFQPTFLAGSPAIWKNVSKYCLEKKITLPSVKHLVMFGAPIEIEMHENFKEILPNGDTFTPYGATECLPVSLVRGSEILSKFKDEMKKGKGTCIGKIAQGSEVKIIKTSDQEISEFTTDLELKTNQIGEIIIKSPFATKEYYQMSTKTKLAKIKDIKSSFWHRMGDLGFLDKDQNLWFCGRKNHRVQTRNKTFYSTQVEAVFNNMEEIQRSALISYENSPALVIQLKNFNKKADQHVKERILNQAKEFDHTKEIQKIFFCEAFPVDIRHNIKIDRERLSHLALKGELIS